MRAEYIQQRGYWAEAIGKPRQCDGCRQRHAATARVLDQLALPS